MQPRSEMEAELKHIAQRIARQWEQFQVTDCALTKGELYRRYRTLGSDKTLARFAAGDFSDTKTTLERWLSQYRAVWEILPTDTPSAALSMRHLVYLIRALRTARGRTAIGLLDQIAEDATRASERLRADYF